MCFDFLKACNVKKSNYENGNLNGWWVLLVYWLKGFGNIYPSSFQWRIFFDKSRIFMLNCWAFNEKSVRQSTNYQEMHTMSANFNSNLCQESQMNPIEFEESIEEFKKNFKEIQGIAKELSTISKQSLEIAAVPR